MNRRGFLRALGIGAASPAIAPLAKAFPETAVVPALRNTGSVDKRERVPIMLALGGRGKLTNFDGGDMGRGSGPMFVMGTREEAERCRRFPQHEYLLACGDKAAWEKLTS